ncbi:MAG: SDR family NAD(P)-dependent oxidoreductase, partial [Myxococcales bacterium]|nr:SDR family NAD(P)-dependent oxidoreductase [Myxococcales bacterium]
MSAPGKLDGKVVLITGAARGQGEAEARLFVAEGAKVVLGDVLDAEGKAVAESLGDAAEYVHHDVSDPESWEAFAETAARRYGRVDALVNNAGIMVYKPMEEMTLEEYRQVIDVNQVGCFLGMKAVL